MNFYSMQCAYIVTDTSTIMKPCEYTGKTKCHFGDTTLGAIDQINYFKAIKIVIQLHKTRLNMPNTV